MKDKSYSDFWNEKGEYGKERVKRMIQRKKDRHYRRLVKVSQRITFECEMGYGSCERRGYFNGDC